MHPNWKALPVEILHNIFKELDVLTLREVAAVCKFWSHPVRSLIFSNVYINHFAQLRRFHSTLQEYPHLGNEVKTLHLMPVYGMRNDTIKAELYNIVASFLNEYMNNLVEFHDGALHSYLPIVNALVDSRLKKLKRLDLPTPDIVPDLSEVPSYITCALMMKDRLENIYYTDNVQMGRPECREQIFFNQIYNRLNDFDKLTSVSVFKLTSEAIQDLEYITNSCKSLKRLKFEVGTASSTESLHSLSEITPRPDVQSLKISKLIRGDLQAVIPYLMHKFPQLNYFQLHMNLSGNNEMDRPVFAQFLQYLFFNKEVVVSGIKVNHTDMNECVGEAWDATSKSGSQYLDLVYGDSESFMMKKEAKSCPETTITYARPIEWSHVEFIEKSGRFLRRLQFQNYRDSQDPVGEGLLPLLEDFTVHTLTHCRLLTMLTLANWQIQKPSNIDAVSPLEDGSLDLLMIENCTIDRGGLDGFKALMRSIVQLDLWAVQNSFGLHDVDENGCTKILDIDLPNTALKVISFYYECTPEDLVCIQVHITNGAVLYYCYDPDEITFCKELSHEEYSKLDKHRFVKVTCASLPEIQFEESMDYTDFEPQN